MHSRSHRNHASQVIFFLLSSSLVAGALAQQSTNAKLKPKKKISNPHTEALPVTTSYFTPGNIVVVVEGCGVHAGTCTSVPNGTGTGAGNSSVGGYGDNEAAPLTLFQYTPNGTASVNYMNSLVLPQTGSGANLPVSGEYGSSSEGTLQLDGTGRYLTLMGYGIDAPAFDAAYHPATPPGNYTSCGPGVTDDPYGSAPSGALAQSGSLTGQCYAPVARVLSLIDPYGNVNSATAIYNVFNTNNPRSVYTLDGSTSAYISGQGTGCDATGGVFYINSLFTTMTAPTAITGNDGFGGNSSCPNVSSSQTLAQDTRDVQIYNNTLYISTDTTEGSGTNRSLIGTLGTPPNTTLFTGNNPSTGQVGSGNTGSLSLNGFGNNKTGKITITTGASTNGNSLNNSTSKVNNVALDLVNLSPMNYFFASPSVLYVTDGGNPKNNSNGNNNSNGTANIGDGGLQKWVNSSSNGTGTWSLKYTLYLGLNLVNNGGTSGTTGLYGLAGVVNGPNVNLYVTNYNLSDLDTTYLYGITDTLATTTNPSTVFTLLDTAPSDSNFKGVSFAPSLPAGSATITSSPSGLAVTASGTGCAPGTYITPFTLAWTPGSACQLSVISPQSASGTSYVFSAWQDGTTSTSDAVVAPSTAAVYKAAFKAVPTVTFPTASPITYGQALSSTTLTGGSASVSGTFAFTSPNTIPGAGTAPQSVAFTPSDTADYTTVTGNISVTVSKAVLTVKANNASMAVGASIPSFTAGYSGFVNGDMASSLSGSPSLSTTATSSSPAGTYPIVAAQGTLSSQNYSFSFVNGTLSIVAQQTTVVLNTSAVVSGSASAGYTATITVTNTGTGRASNVVLSTATLASVAGSPLPQSLGSIAGSGGTATTTVSFPGSVGADGARAAAAFAGTYTGGTFSGSARVVLP